MDGGAGTGGGGGGGNGDCGEGVGDTHSAHARQFFRLHFFDQGVVPLGQDALQPAGGDAVGGGGDSSGGNGDGSETTTAEFYSVHNKDIIIGLLLLHHCRREGVRGVSLIKD